MLRQFLCLSESLSFGLGEMFFLFFAIVDEIGPIHHGTEIEAHDFHLVTKTTLKIIQQLPLQLIPASVELFLI